MGSLLDAIVVFALLIVLLSTGTWIFVSILLTTALALLFLGDFSLTRLGLIAKPIVLGSVTSWELAALPMFIWMGEIINSSNLSVKLFRGLSPLVRPFPGGLLHTNIAGCVLFSAMSGSSVATAATIGRATSRSLAERGYDVQLSAGSVAAGGTIGILIPPSITLIIFGLVAEVSVAKLFAAGILPGLLLGMLFSAYIAIRCLFNRALAPRVEAPSDPLVYLRSIWDLAPILLLIIVVLGGIYSGIATPSEAAAVGVLGALLTAAFSGGFAFRDVVASALKTVSITAMLGTALGAASLLSTSLAFLRIPQSITSTIVDMGLGPYLLIAVILIFYVVLGCILESISMLLLTVPITLPLVVASGFDPIWFGIFVILVIEMGLITPPVGFNLFVLRGVTGLPIGQIATGALPFFFLMILATILLVLFPSLALWLPELLFSRH